MKQKLKGGALGILLLFLIINASEEVVIKIFQPNKPLLAENYCELMKNSPKTCLRGISSPVSDRMVVQRP